MNGVGNDTAGAALGDAITSLIEAPVRMASALADALARRGPTGCDIPPPCWEPRSAGTCRLTLTPGGTGTVRVRVSNCGWNRQVVAITASGVLAGWLKFEPTTLIVGPQETATFVVTVHVPDHVKPGAALSGPLLVRGCNDHHARMHIAIAECAGVMCCDVAVDDCPDNVHHWYDHFYCARPCRNGRMAGAVNRG